MVHSRRPLSVRCRDPDGTGCISLGLQGVPGTTPEGGIPRLISEAGQVGDDHLVQE